MALSKHGRGVGSRGPSDHFQVYVLRERETGAIVFVGCRSYPENDHHGTNMDCTGVHAGTSMSPSAERADELELVVLAEHVGDLAEAIRLETAVMSAYRAARLTPARSARANAVHSDVMGVPDRVQAGRVASDAGSGHGPEFLDAGHRQRLEDLILRQHREIADLNEALDRVRALRDLQQWANGSGHLRVADLDRALGSTS